MAQVAHPEQSVPSALFKRHSGVLICEATVCATISLSILRRASRALTRAVSHFFCRLSHQTQSTHTTMASDTVSEIWSVIRPAVLPSSPVRTQLGEGPLWSVADQCLYWLDIEQHRLHRHTPAEKEGSPERDIFISTEQLGMIGCLALTNRPQQILLASQKGLALFDWSTLRSCILAPFPAGVDAVAFRFNDGEVTPTGTLLVGTMQLDEESGKDKGVMVEYRWEEAAADGSAGGRIVCEQIFDKATCPNGQAWSADGKTLYYIDTPTRRVDAFDYDPSAASPSARLSNRRPVCQIDPTHHHPDGMTMDAAGQLWIAHWEGSRVTVWDPATGEFHRSISLPASKITSACFGGPDLEDLYVTSASRDCDLQADPHAGDLFVLRKVGAKGKEAVKFQGDLKVDEAKAVQHKRG